MGQWVPNSSSGSGSATGQRHALVRGGGLSKFPNCLLGYPATNQKDTGDLGAGGRQRETFFWKSRHSVAPESDAASSLSALRFVRFVGRGASALAALFVLRGSVALARVASSACAAFAFCSAPSLFSVTLRAVLGVRGLRVFAKSALTLAIWVRFEGGPPSDRGALGSSRWASGGMTASSGTPPVTY